MNAASNAAPETTLPNEAAIVARDLILTSLTGARYHVAHLSTAGAVEMVREAKARGLEVTAEMRAERAEEIARRLNDTKTWHSHSRGISMEVVRRDLKLQIEDFDEVPHRGSRIRTYYKLLQGYIMDRGHEIVLHRRGRYSLGGPS